MPRIIVAGSGGGSGGAPSGAAGGDLAGSTYPNPTVAAGVITLAKQANLAANSIQGNNTGSPAVPLALTAAQVKTLLAVDLSGTDVTGILAAARHPALTGDVTTSSGAIATTIAAGAVTLAKQANLAANSIIGNNTGSAAVPLALTRAQTMALLSAGAGAAFDLNSQKITSLANGSGAQDAAAFGQIPLVNNAATNVANLGTQAIGATGKWADAGHVHSRETQGGYLPVDYGYKAWAFDPNLGAGGLVLPTAGLVHGSRIWLPTMTVTNIIMLVTTAGVTLTAGQCFAALFDDTGGAPVLLSATADQSGTWNSLGMKTMALSAAQAITAGFFNIAVFFNGTTGPALYRANNVSNLSINMGLASPHLRSYTADAARTTTFATPMGAQTGIATQLWAAVS